MTRRNTFHRPLTTLQQAILDVLWAQGPATSETIREALYDTHPLKDSSIRTLLRRLEAQGVTQVSAKCSSIAAGVRTAARASSSGSAPARSKVPAPGWWTKSAVKNQRLAKRSGNDLTLFSVLLDVSLRVTRGGARGCVLFLARAIEQRPACGLDVRPARDAGHAGASLFGARCDGRRRSRWFIDIRRSQSSDSGDDRAGPGGQEWSGTSDARTNVDDGVGAVWCKSSAADSPAATDFSWWPAIALVIYTGGVVFFLARLTTGLAGRRRLVREAERLTVPAAAPVYASRRVSVPLTARVFAPIIILPNAWTTWPSDQLAAVLAHEGAHVRRRDALVLCLAYLTRTLYWFTRWRGGSAGRAATAERATRRRRQGRR
jgi:hypothetical protein